MNCANYEFCNSNGHCECNGKTSGKTDVMRCSGYGTCGDDGVCSCDSGYYGTIVRPPYRQLGHAAMTGMLKMIAVIAIVVW